MGVGDLLFKGHRNLPRIQEICPHHQGSLTRKVKKSGRVVVYTSAPWKENLHGPLSGKNDYNRGLFRMSLDSRVRDPRVYGQ